LALGDPGRLNDGLFCAESITLNWPVLNQANPGLYSPRDAVQFLRTPLFAGHRGLSDTRAHGP